MTKLGSGLANQMRALGYRAEPASEGTGWIMHPPHSDVSFMAKDASEAWEMANAYWHQQNLAKIVFSPAQPKMTHDAPDLLAVERMAEAIRDVNGGENYDYMDFCRDAARAAYATLAATNAQQAAQIAALREALEGATKALENGVAAIDQYNAENGTHLCGGALFGMAKAIEPARAALALSEKDQDDD